jgi:hypothetical protein
MEVTEDDPTLDAIDDNVTELTQEEATEVPKGQQLTRN